MRSKGNDVLMIQGEAGNLSDTTSPGNKELVVADGYIGLKIGNSLQNGMHQPLVLKKESCVFRKHVGCSHLMTTHGCDRVGTVEYRVFRCKKGRSMAVADKEKFVLLEVSGHTEGSYGMSVSGSVYTI